MTHLSDFSFLERATMLTYLWFFLLYHIWQCDRFQCLAFTRVRNFELKTIVTILLLISIPFQLYYDITSVKIKYTEGYFQVGPDHIVSKPRQFWSASNQDLVLPTDYSLMVGFSFQTGTLFLLQSFWNYLAGSVAKASFMGSFEFKLYIFWTACTIVMFPILQFLFRGNDLLTEVVPEFAYGISLFIIGCLGVLSHFRFNNLIKSTRDARNGKTVAAKLQYFLRMNIYMTLVLFSDAASFIVLSADALTTAKYLNSNKFTADLIIGNANFSAIILWYIVILIVHPPANFGGARGETSCTTGSAAPTPVVLSAHRKNDSYVAFPGVNISMEDLKNVQGDIEPPYARSPRSPTRRPSGSPVIISFPATQPIREEGVDFYPVAPGNSDRSLPLAHISDRVPLSPRKYDESSDSNDNYHYYYHQDVANSHNVARSPPQPPRPGSDRSAKAPKPPKDLYGQAL